MCNYEDYIKANVFKILSGVDVTLKVERKNGFNYLSWADAWCELKRLFPDATSTVYENKDGWNYHTDGRTAWVKVGVTIKGLEHIEYLPVMDYRNNSIPLDKITSFDVNKAIQRAIAKAVARHGLGLSIFAKEDLPQEDPSVQPPRTKSNVVKPASKRVEQTIEKKFICNDCKNSITEHQGVSAEAIANATKKKYGVMLCKACADNRRLGQEEQKMSPVEEAYLQTVMNEPEDEGELPFDIC